MTDNSAYRTTFANHPQVTVEQDDLIAVSHKGDLYAVVRDDEAGGWFAQYYTARAFATDKARWDAWDVEPPRFPTCDDGIRFLLDGQDD